MEITQEMREKADRIITDLDEAFRVRNDAGLIAADLADIYRDFQDFLWMLGFHKRARIAPDGSIYGVSYGEE